MLFAAIILAAIAVFLIQEKVYEKKSFDGLHYDVSFSAEEVFEGEDVYMFEELTNGKALPLPNVRAEHELPEGLSFERRTQAGKKNRKTMENPHSVESVFVLKSDHRIRRRWRVRCGKRGVYTVGSVLLITSDLFGASTWSKKIEGSGGKRATVTVLPAPIDLSAHFTDSRWLNGERPVEKGLLTDPMNRCGTREYTPLDPMSKINWTSTAVHGKLMVNVEEYSTRHSFSILLNMQSRPIELHPDVPSDEGVIELCVTVAASLLDRISAEETPVRLFCNTDPAPLASLGVEGTGEEGKIAVTRPFAGRADTIEALRVLASLPMSISCPMEKMLDQITRDSTAYTSGGNLIVVSGYLDERMIVFHDVMRSLGCRVVFYITGSNRNAVSLPDDIEVYFRTWSGKGGAA